METEYIRREAAEQIICEACERPGCPILWGDGCNIIDRLNTIHAADVRPVVRGKWEKHEDFDHYGGGRFVEWVCSECDKRLRGDWATRNHIEETPTENFCPNCGADMREVKVNEIVFRGN